MPRYVSPFLFPGANLVERRGGPLHDLVAPVSSGGVYIRRGVGVLARIRAIVQCWARLFPKAYETA